MKENVAMDVLAMQLVASQSYAEIRTKNLMISNTETDGANLHGRPQVVKEELHNSLLRPEPHMASKYKHRVGESVHFYLHHGSEQDGHRA